MGRERPGAERFSRPAARARLIHSFRLHCAARLLTSSDGAPRAFPREGRRDCRAERAAARSRREQLYGAGTGQLSCGAARRVHLLQAACSS